VNGTIFYDLDAKTRTVIENFASESSLAGRYVRIAARYQQDGTLVATRIYASDEFNNVWVSPEGHVLHVNTTSDMVTVENESGIGSPGGVAKLGRCSGRGRPGESGRPGPGSVTTEGSCWVSRALPGSG